MDRWFIRVRRRWQDGGLGLGRMAGMGRGGMEGGMGGWEGMVGWVVGWDGPGARPTQDKCDTFERGPKVCDFRCIGCQWEWCYENILRTELQPM